MIPISQKLFSLLQEIEEIGEIPCQNAPDMFFPDPGNGGYQDTIWAKKMCEECPVLKSCRNYAIEAKEPFGIWGGLTPVERRTYRRSERNATSSLYPSPSE
jgi:WhiB family redox-sensing transcriptional regulator